MDFYQIKERIIKKEHIEVYPDFLVRPSKDIMIRGKAFYAIWDAKRGIWSTDEYDVARLVDAELWNERKRLLEKDPDNTVSVNTISNFSGNGWLQYCNFIKHSPDNYHTLDDKLAFANTEVKQEDYISKRLPYSLQEGDYSAWDEIVGTLYDPEEREKIEWAIGSVVAGDSKDIQKFLVLYGEAGAGKSTILNIIQKLFKGYYAMFEAKALASSNNAFSTDAFRSNPLVAIQHDGDLSRIEDNSKLNSIISHEEMVLNEKYKSSYTARINCFLFMATNRPVKITDAKSGIIRRLIDVRPSGRRIPSTRYFELMGQVEFELGAIAWHCLEVYKDCGKNYYNAYRPLDMMFKTDVFYNFVEDSFETFRQQNGVSLKQAWDMYKFYCDEALVDHKLPMYRFREELKNYFAEYKDVTRVDNKQVRKYYSGFLSGKFMNSEKVDVGVQDSWLKFDSELSAFDRMAADYPAQLADDEEKPAMAWDFVTTKLRDINTKQLHYVRVPKNHIVIDFDIKDEHKAKSFELNHTAASKFPPTYAELSKSGAGIHLHYIYEGDVDKLAPLYGDDIEIKVFRGKSSLRRKLTMCNDIPIATISSGLPLKGDDTKVIDYNAIKDNDHLVNFIRACLAKKHHGATAPEVNFIYDTLEAVYKSGLTYDVSDMYHDIYQFASNSTHQANRCIELVMKMKFRSKDHEHDTVITKFEFAPDARLTFYDVESYPNLFVIVYKILGGQPIKLINPSPKEVWDLIWTEDGKLAHRWAGFNNKRYDNHMIMARSKGESIYDLFCRSQKIVNGEYGAYVEGAKDISEWDIWDYCSNKQSLKKWEIQLGVKHKEMSIPWDQEVPENMWDVVADYCENDVLATEAVWNATEEDRRAREILAKIAGMTVNTSTNDLTAQIIFGDDRNPQSQFNYRFMGDIPHDIYVLDTDTFEYHEEHGLSAQDLIDRGWYSVFDMKHRPVFPGYTFNQYAKTDKSIYRGVSVGEGGYVQAEPGEYRCVPVLDITSQHPHSIYTEELFGPIYTPRFYELLQMRIHIKHKEYDKARTMLNGVAAEFLQDDSKAKILSKVLKIPINSVYGLTSAKFKNRFRDPRNIDNIVAKRGALFMVNLANEVKKRGYTVAHIKTDSIKIPFADDKIKEFVVKYGEAYGYHFECEEEYDRMCLVNDAVYIAKYSKSTRYNDPDHAGKWTATGAQFAHPFVFKHCFTKEEITFEDLCETKTVQTAMYLDFNEGLPEGEHNYEFVGRAGQYCPIRPGCGGAELLREKDGKYYAVGGTKGYRWLESEDVRVNHKENCINMEYFMNLADAAIANISQYCDYEKFANDPDDYIDITSDELPF